MIKDILKFSVSNIVNLVLGLLSAFILTRSFQPETYGVLNIFNTTVATAISFLYLGLDSSYIRFYNEPPSNNSSSQMGSRLLLCCLSLTTMLGIIMTLFFFDDLTEKIFGFESRLVCALLFISCFSQIILRFLNIKYRMDFNSKAYTVQAILTQVSLKFFVILAALFSLRVEKVLIINVMGVFVLSLIYVVIQRRSFFSFKGFFSFDGYGKVFLFALFSAPLSICINLNNSVSQQIIKSTLGVSSVGIYSSANYFVTVFSALQGGFATYWAAYMYSNYKEKQETIKKVNEYLLLIIIIFFYGMIIMRDVAYLLIGQKYQESKGFFSLVLCYPLLNLAAETTSYGISIKRKNHLGLLCFVVSTVINLLLAYLLTPIYGLKGAAFASMLSGVVLYVLRTVISQRYYSSIYDIKATVIDVSIIVAMSIIPSAFYSVTANILVTVLVLIVLAINHCRVVEMITKVKEALTSRRK